MLLLYALIVRSRSRLLHVCSNVTLSIPLNLTTTQGYPQSRNRLTWPRAARFFIYRNSIVFSLFPVLLWSRFWIIIWIIKIFFVARSLLTAPCVLHLPHYRRSCQFFVLNDDGSGGRWLYRRINIELFELLWIRMLVAYVKFQTNIS